MKRIIILMACGFCLLQAIFAQNLSLPADADYQAPLDFDLCLAGNYGELRPNHFHAGLDFKTQGSVGHPVHAFANGYVSRVAINAYGYGLVVYVRHPELGVSTVYAHLSEFSSTIINKVRAKQALLEQNNANIFFEPDEIPVKKGEVIAKSGNTGSSGGPHVHFEIRDCNDEDDTFYDPLPLFKKQIADKTAPRIEQIYVYPLGGVVKGGTERRQSGIVRQPDGSQNLKTPMTAWGRIGLGLKAFDHMDGQSNIYGIKYVKLYSGDSLLFSFSGHQFRYSEQRYTNSLIDYDAWKKHRSTIMKTFIEPGNHLQMLDYSLGDGTVVIDEERLYPFRYELSDEYGNKTSFSFTVKGVKSQLPAPRQFEGYRFVPGHDLSIDTLGCSISIPSGTLYTETDLVVQSVKEAREQSGNIGTVIRFGNELIPVHSYYNYSIKVPIEVLDTLRNPQQLYLVNLDGGYIGGKYERGSVNASLREFGRFALRLDNTAPTAAFPQMSRNRAEIKVEDLGSGISQFKVWIDDRFVPFDMDNRGRYFAVPSQYGIVGGTTHTIRVWLVDRCGNENTIELTRKF